MLDVFSHFAAMDLLRARLGAEVALGAVTDARAKDAYAALTSDYSYALLGSVFDHLLAHDGPSDNEVNLLREASNLWGKMRIFVDDYRTARQQIEDITQDPSAPNALSLLNAARFTLGKLVDRYDQLVAGAQAFVFQLELLIHVKQHPLAQDQPVKAWPWRDVILSRGTGLLAAEVMKIARAEGSPQAFAFGLGMMGNHVSNAIGSPYLVHSVGGPRRSHPYRDRVASYAVGAWLRHVPPFLPMVDRDPSHQVPLFGSPEKPVLPVMIEGLIQKALDAVYRSKGPTTLSNVSAAYVQFVEHWHLLQTFSPIVAAPPINATIRTTMRKTLTPADWSRPSSPGRGSEEAGRGPAPGPGGNLFDPGPGAPPWFASNHPNWTDWVREVCLDILFAPILLIRSIAYWHREVIKKESPSKGEARGALSQPLTSAEYSAIMGSKDNLLAVNELFYLDAQLDIIAAGCLRVMKYAGLIYPEPNDLLDPTLAGFVVLPPPGGDFAWPKRPLADPNLFLGWPATKIENPIEPPVAFLPFEKPTAFMIKTGGAGPTIAAEGLDMLLKEVQEDPESPVRKENLNLDADRGVGQTCWRPNGSIESDPLDIVPLKYNEV